MIEKLDCILSKRATRPVYIWTYQYGWMPSARTRVNSHLLPYETSLSPAIQDITVHGHTRHLRLHLYKTSPPQAVQDISVSGWDLYMQYSPLLLYTIERETKQNEKEWNKVTLITASLKPSKREQGKSTAVAWGWPSIKKQRNPHAQKWNDHKLTSITIAPSPLWISRAYPSTRPWLVYLPHSRSYARRSSQLSCGHGGLDYCDSKRRYASCELLWFQLRCD